MVGAMVGASPGAVHGAAHGSTHGATHTLMQFYTKSVARTAPAGGGTASVRGCAECSRSGATGIAW
eukprot:scaffold10478_cov48-Phaeocystis_antarctica.AAC.1